MRLIWVLHGITAYSMVINAQECLDWHYCEDCGKHQEVFCSSECLQQGTVGYLQDGRTFTCAMKSAYKNIPRPTKNDKTALEAKSFKITCDKTFNDRLMEYRPTLNISWDHEETQIRKGDVTGFYLSANKLHYHVSIDIKDGVKSNISNVPIKKYIRFRDDCFGVKNVLLGPKKKLQFWLASLPMSQPDDANRNGLCIAYTIPELEKCGKTSPESTTEQNGETTKKQTKIQEKEGDSEAILIGGIAVMLLIIVVIAVVMVYNKCSKFKKQGEMFNNEMDVEQQRKRCQNKLTNILMISDITKNCDEAHRIAAITRAKFPLKQIVCNWENRNEDLIVNWYLSNIEKTDLVIFFEGAEETYTVLSKQDIKQNDVFSMAINYFFHNSLKPSIFLVKNNTDVTYFKTMHRKNCSVYLLRNNSEIDEEFYEYLENDADNSQTQIDTNNQSDNKNDVRRSFRHRQKQIEHSGRVEEVQKLITEENQERDGNGNTVWIQRDEDNYIKRGARPKERKNSILSKS